MHKDGSFKSFYRHAWVGLGSVLLAAGGLVAWSATTEVAGAVIASGSFAVEGGSKRVQHQEGGIVSEILVENEDVVEAGEVMVRLDGTATAAELAIVDAQLAEAIALHARLAAESTGREAMPVTTFQAAGLSLPLDGLFSAQQRLLTMRAATQRGIGAQLEEQIRQLDIQVEGLESEALAVRDQLAILEDELTKIETLLADGLVEAGRVNTTKREVARLQGEGGRIKATIASARTAISERQLQIAQRADEFQTQVLEDMQSAGQRIAELKQQKIAAEDRLARLELRAPRSGIVHESVVQTVGGVVGAGETLMMIVPQAEELTLTARVIPSDVDKVSVGQEVTVRLPGLDAKRTPELVAAVTAIAPDLGYDTATGAPFYTVRIELSEVELARLPDDVALVPGMPAEAFIRTDDRTVLSYLIHPLADQISHTFREAD